ncbi:MAG: hypothetical protein KIS73_20610 [Enhydrobacter sp.]|nr:hypothetical protein [Enhydrobacter sp.]
MAVTTGYDFDDSQDAQNVPLAPITGNAAITSLANGGFVGIGDRAGSIVGKIYNSAGKRTATFANNLGTNGSIDQLSDGNLVIASQTADSILVKVVDSVTGTDIVSPFVLNHEIGTSNPDVIALSGGGFWVVSHTHFQGSDNDINFDIFDNNGVLVGLSVLDVSLEDDRDAAVTQLDGGNVVVSWTRTIGTQTEIWYSVLTASGATVKGPTLADTKGAENKHVDVTALDGGGFALVYQDSQWSPAPSSLTLAKFDAAGTSRGKFNITPFTAGSVEPSVIRLSNGLLAVAEIRSTLAFVTLVDPATGQALASRDVIGDFDGFDPHDAVVAAFGIGRVAVFYNDTTENLSGGSAFNIVRTSVSDSLPFAGDTVNGDDFIDRIFGGNGDDTLNGGGNDDEIHGGNGVDTIDGGDGNDFIEGGQGYDYIRGGRGDDTIFFMTQDEADSSFSGGEARGDDGNDRITGSIAAESLSGDAGNDILDGRGSDDMLDGGSGIDSASYASAASAVTATLTDKVGGHTGGSSSGGGGNDTFVDIESLTGSRFGDTLTGNRAANVLDGQAGADTMQGGRGNDTYFVDRTDDQVIEDANRGTDLVNSSANFTLSANVERLTLTGDATISGTGNELANIITGNDRNNRIDGKEGNDTLIGGGGSDSFFFTTALDAATNLDTVADFVSGTDRMQLDRTVFTAVDQGALSAAAFVQAAAATTTKHRIIYDVTTGVASYDADGSGAGAAVAFAQFTPGQTLVASDFKGLAL